MMWVILFFLQMMGVILFLCADDGGDPAAARASFIVKLATVLKQIVETSVPQESSTKRYHVPPLHKHNFSETAE